MKSMIPVIVLMALAVLFVLVLAWPSIKHPHNRRLTQLGAVVVTYECPLSVQGTTTGPTAAQAASTVEVSATIVASADADTAATVTHNWGLSTAALALGHPWVILEPLLSEALTALSAWTITTKTLNVVTLTKLASTGSGSATAQLRVHIVKPSSYVGQFPTS
jgi:hypothetical protein